MRGGQGWPWVNASGIQGVRTIEIEPVARKTTPRGGHFSIRWLGFVEPDRTAKYSFHARTDGIVKLYVDDRSVLDNSRRVRGPIDEASGSTDLQAGRRYPIRVEYSHAKDSRPTRSLFELAWSAPGLAKQIVPAARLMTPDRRPGALSGLYYDQPSPTGPAIVHDDPTLAFDFGPDWPPPLNNATRPASPVDRPFTVRLYFAEPDALSAGQRVFTVRLQGQNVLNRFDIAKEAGGPMRGLVREFRNVRVKETLKLEFTPATQLPPLICGVELIAE